MGKKNIYILATGGTIAGRAASETATTGYQAGAIGVAELLAAVPELKAFANVRGEQIAAIDSKDMTSAIWLQLAKRCEEILSQDDIDGIVITHGTDTMEETGYFLNLTVHSDKPVVLTGAMRPATAVSADGPMNLLQAVRVAVADDAQGKGVLIVMNGTIVSAREAVKTHTTSLDTFKSPEIGDLGTVQDGEPVFYRQPLRRHTRESQFDVKGVQELPRVSILYAHADDDGSGQLPKAALKALFMPVWAMAASPSASNRNSPKPSNRASSSCAARAALLAASQGQRLRTKNMAL